MIEWAEKQPPTDRVQASDMLEQIHEDWSAHYCPLCQAAFRDCQHCILAMGCMPCSHPQEYEGEIEWYKMSEWQKMAASKTWGEWLKYAKVMRNIMVKIRGTLERGGE